LALSGAGSSGAQGVPVNRFPEHELSENDNKPDELDEARDLRAKQREKLAEGMNLIKPVVFIPLVVGLVVAIILFFTPTDTFKFRPFKKVSDSSSNETQESDTGYKDSDFNW